jgi:hypothetical protein
MAEAVALVRAFDQAGHVGHDEAPVVAQPHDAQVGYQRGEGVVGDLGPRRRDARDHRRLAGVGKAHQADVGQQLHLEPEILDLPGSPGWTLRGARLVDVAKCALPRPPRPPRATRHALTILREIAEQVQRRNRDRRSSRTRACRSALRARDPAPPRPGAVGSPGPWRPRWALKFGMKAEVDEGVDVRAGDDPHRSAGSAVAAARTAARDELLAAERQAPASAVACCNVNVDFVDEQVTRGLEC